MKIRNGFVSNSSSSSFTIIYDEKVEDIDKLNECEIKTNKYMFIGKYLYNGIDIIDIGDNETLNAIKKIPNALNNFSIIKNPRKLDNTKPVKITDDMVGKYIMFEEVDYYCTQPDHIIDTYVDK
jgi:hypothetical protein